VVRLCDHQYFHCAYYLPRYKSAGWVISNQQVITGEGVLVGYVDIGFEEMIFYGKGFNQLCKFELMVM